jgi:hypothetical protein
MITVPFQRLLFRSSAYHTIPPLTIPFQRLPFRSSSYRSIYSVPNLLMPSPLLLPRQSCSLTIPSLDPPQHSDNDASHATEVQVVQSCSASHGVRVASHGVMQCES